MYRKWAFVLVLFVVGMFPRVALAQQEIVEETIVDLSERLNVLPEEITEDSVVDVMWSNPFLGCDLPENADIAIPMVVVSGWRITLSVDGETYYYHASKEGRWIYCLAEYSTPGYTGHTDISVLETVPLSVNLSDISVLSNTTTVQIVFLMMLFGTIYTVYRVNCAYERR